MSEGQEKLVEVKAAPNGSARVLGLLGRLKTLDVVIIVVGFYFLGQAISLHRVTDFMIFCIFVMSFDLLYGYMGRLSFGHMLFMGTGAYVTALFIRHVSDNPLLAIAVALAAGAVIAAVTGPILIHTSGATFALIALALNQVGFFLAQSGFQEYTHGDNGISCDPATLGFLNFSSRPVMFGFVLFCLVVVFFLLKMLTRSSYGILIRSIKEDEARVKFLGYNTTYYKWLTYVISGTVACLPGALNALNYQFVSPSIIDTHRNVEVIFAALIGGAGNLYGALVGGVVFMLISNLLPTVTDRWELVLGIVLLGLVFYFRRGITGFIGDLLAWGSRLGSLRPGVERQ
ncbi:MAG: branched-chain amino acid ABC transporter permease [Chloroflexota bacterium]